MIEQRRGYRIGESAYLRDIGQSTDPSDNTRKIMDVRDGLRLYVTLYRATRGAGPIPVGVIRRMPNNGAFRIFSPNGLRAEGRTEHVPGDEIGHAIRASDHAWNVYGPQDHAGAAVRLGTATSLSVACDALLNGVKAASSEADPGPLTRTSGKFRRAAPGCRPGHGERWWA